MIVSVCSAIPHRPCIRASGKFKGHGAPKMLAQWLCPLGGSATLIKY